MDAISKTAIDGFEAVSAAASAPKEAQNVLANRSAVEVQARRAQKERDDQTAYKPSREELAQVTDELNNMAKVLQTSLRFGYSDDIDALYLRVLDGQGAVIRQIPTEDAIRLIAGMRELTGMLFDDRV
ncbi:flagellar protein FlaG [Campylobacterota bacterium]|nr:flagellar protein FlaG [Campylobacterota bacterium]